MSPASSSAPVIFVLAGVNGAGKSSIGGARLRQEGLNYFNPDEAAQRIREEIGCSIDEARSLAWHEGKRRLEEAIDSRSNHAFESTLGGNTIPGLLEEAALAGFDVLVWFIGLGHDIPEAKIRERWDASRRNVIKLMPFLAELKLFDNSREGNRTAGRFPEPALLLHWQRGRIVSPPLTRLQASPEWAKPIIARALQLQR